MSIPTLRVPLRAGGARGIQGRVGGVQMDPDSVVMVTWQTDLRALHTRHPTLHETHQPLVVEFVTKMEGLGGGPQGNHHHRVDYKPFKALVHLPRSTVREIERRYPHRRLRDEALMQAAQRQLCVRLPEDFAVLYGSYSRDCPEARLYVTFDAMEEEEAEGGGGDTNQKKTRKKTNHRARAHVKVLGIEERLDDLLDVGKCILTEQREARRTARRGRNAHREQRREANRRLPIKKRRPVSDNEGDTSSSDGAAGGGGGGHGGGSTTMAQRALAAAQAVASQAAYAIGHRLLKGVNDGHSVFQYYVHGLQPEPLRTLLPDDLVGHTDDCHQMCMYEMLRKRNESRVEAEPRSDRSQCPQSPRVHLHRCFDPDQVHRWLVDRGVIPSSRALTDGLAVDELVEHARYHRYNLVALDITRSVITLHIDSHPRKDYKTIAFVVVGDHARPFTDPDVIKSIVDSASRRLGKNRITNYSFYGRGGSGGSSNHDECGTLTTTAAPEAEAAEEDGGRRRTSSSPRSRSSSCGSTSLLSRCPSDVSMASSATGSIVMEMDPSSNTSRPSTPTTSPSKRPEKDDRPIHGFIARCNDPHHVSNTAARIRLQKQRINRAIPRLTPLETTTQTDDDGTEDSAATAPATTIASSSLVDRSGQWPPPGAPDAPLDWELDDHDDEGFEDTKTMLGSQPSMAVRTESLASATKKSKRRQYPLASEDAYFHLFTKKDGKEFIEGRLRPEYREGNDPFRIHYFVCTDQKHIEFLYDYCIHILCWDPTTAARSHNGHCTTLTLNNVIWCANEEIHAIRRLHTWLHPTEPFRLCGLASYAYRMLYKELTKVGPRGTNLWDCMSAYSPNLARLMDGFSATNRPKLLQRTYQPPYAVPERPEEAPTVCIPEDERRRWDLIRSYTAALLDMVRDRDQFPIHDVTNVVVPFEVGLHGHYPIGHYRVVVPTRSVMQARGTEDDWRRLPTFEPGESRMMSHRLVKALIRRGLLEPLDIQSVCQTDEWRQRQWGPALVEGIDRFLRLVCTHPELQSADMAPLSKMLVNYLVGLCNGTSMPHSGNRFVFRSLEEMFGLMMRVYTEDQRQYIRMKRCVGTDAYWYDRAYHYFQFTNSGVTHRMFHLQPVYTMVLENQAMRMFDYMRPIPVDRLIQVNIDACEVWIPTAERQAEWVVGMFGPTSPQVALDAYKAATPAELYNSALLGRYKPEAIKKAEDWKAYHLQYQTARMDTQIRQATHGVSTHEEHRALVLQSGVRGEPHRGVADATTLRGLEALVDPETPVVYDGEGLWRSLLRVFRPEARVRDVDWLEGQIRTWLNLLHRGDHGSNGPRTGLLLTGPAGTGKTFVLRHLYDHATQQGLCVVRTAFTHAACVQLGPDTMTLSSLFGFDHVGDHRCTMVMSRRFQAHLRNLHIDILIVDEISMIPLDLLECLLMFHRTAPQTRLVLSGDFNQLPPVEPHRGERPEGYNYFDATDIIPYLCYDRVRNVHGDWWQLTECMRTDDPLLQAICRDPTYVTSDRFDPKRFPVNVVEHGPVWRFLCYTNQTRKAVNWYCMQRWCEAHPDAVTVAFDLKEIYVYDKLHPQPTANGKIYPPRFDAEHYAKEFDAIMDRVHSNAKNAKKSREDCVSALTCLTTATDGNMDCSMPPPPPPLGAGAWGGGYAPRHWIYLQSFVYGVGMEVVSRRTLVQTPGTTTTPVSAAQRTSSSSRGGGGGEAPFVVNNRRAVILALDSVERTVRLRWCDVQARIIRHLSEETDKGTTHRDGVVVPPVSSSSKSARMMIQELEEEDVTLPFTDFAFNFTPGFCTTTHLSQGETIREHYAIVEWGCIVSRPTAAYVAVTRAADPAFLHIVTDPTSDPWGTCATDDPGVNLLRKLYALLRADTPGTPLLPWHRVPLTLYTSLKKVLTDAVDEEGSSLLCTRCQGVLKIGHYVSGDPARFELVVTPGWYEEHGGDDNSIVSWCCRDCSEILAEQGGGCGGGGHDSKKTMKKKKAVVVRRYLPPPPPPPASTRTTTTTTTVPVGEDDIPMQTDAEDTVESGQSLGPIAGIVYEERDATAARWVEYVRLLGGGPSSSTSSSSSSSRMHHHYQQQQHHHQYAIPTLPPPIYQTPVQPMMMDHDDNERATMMVDEP